MTAATGSANDEAWELLRWARRLTEPELRAAVARFAAPVRTVAGYHFGWWDEAGRATQVGWGKGIRGALVLSGARALGGRVSEAVPVAAAVELVHNFSVVHDDVMDGDRTRRGRATAWSVFGARRAVSAGDAMLAAAWDLVAGGYPAARELSDALRALVAGQSADLTFEGRDDVGLAECVAMAAGKTASLLAAAGALGALAAGAEPARVAALRRFGHHLGLAFQLVDDLLGIWGDPAVTGKASGADLRRRKKTLPVVAALTAGTPAADRLGELYRGRGPLAEPRIPEAARLVREAGGGDWAHREALRRRELARTELSAARPSPTGARALDLIADLVTHRDL
ncbi:MULTISPECIES: polyprenyl synthetase family protein [Streptomycetaceae]|uniref:Dimethylallyltranstransferase / geranyltranstransferase / geranylgeranyl pyrophosphate synthetase n=1 Tax=Streptantibioticus cattleyicolor (strain ATCC 35852 / DSM 46488 / JCM 4925 / NBRC 14057 / NRRL 8057) TaxID=1003195 RepID=F8K0H7_STREN|nr:MULTISPECIES: polyprenyl synthetase family protein [Streptomycetaceae]AEW97379.1 dimethylallyltranstransferase / geranyltranstransferase / geranylgeranyl pyrophosphate synthetase [Streptantibioticus cattleyicolor NRRL 8057 = DSM 46488]MYS61827.1 polyprenyl synthetase family protein [Streptomyces sp. SID5468]CCB77704.1 putative geranylgeranyl pyrophosphate synthetase [Includes: Dimethylallyltranstransferase; Geranyltranstransferase; Farnesyltranstransferase] [Streptantibioticus cattleyicolor N